MKFLDRFRRGLPPEDKTILAEAHARIRAEAEKIEQEKRLEKVLLSDPLDYGTLIQIGKKIGADALEIINVNGSVVRYYFNMDNKIHVDDERLEFEDAFGVEHK